MINIVDESGVKNSGFISLTVIPHKIIINYKEGKKTFRSENLAGTVLLKRPTLSSVIAQIYVTYPPSRSQ